MHTFIGHFNYIVLLLLISGAGMLFHDVKGYDKEQMYKEKKASKYLGWFNVGLGFLLWGSYWFLSK